MAQNDAAATDAQDARPLDASDLSEGDAVTLEFSDDDLGDARYVVEGEWSEDEVADLEGLDRPDEEAEGMFPGLKVRRVWTENAGDYQRLPRLRATLVLDADSYTAGLVDNYPDDETEGYEQVAVSRAEVAEFEDRADLQGSLDSPGASHVVRVVREAFEENELVATVGAENVTIQGADESGTGAFGDDLGVTVHFNAQTDLQTREAFEAELRDRLNAGYWFEKERSTVWTFLLDRDGETNPVR